MRDKPHNPPPTDASSAAERLTVGLVTAFFTLFGWFTLVNGGVALRGRKGNESLVDGAAALAIAASAFLIAALCLTLLLRRAWPAPRAVFWACLVALLLPPLLFVLLAR